MIRESGARNSNREREVAGMSRALKLAAKENEVGIIALSQTNEAGQLRESRAIELGAQVGLHLS
ncbi:MAG: DnaB-like helicase C-terminal domain-containing protein [Verrucomicrobiota bacterium]